MYVQNIVSHYIVRSRIPSGDDLELSFPLFVTNQLLGNVATVAQIAGTLGLVAPKGSYFVGLSFLLCVMLSLFYRIVLMADEAVRRGSAE